MNLVEILVAASMVAFSASASLQVWAAGARWTERAEQRQHQHQQLEGELLAVQAKLLQLAGTPIAADCDAAADWLTLHLPVLERHGDGVLLRLRAADGSERERWYDPAAYGLCGPAPADPGPATG